MAQPNKDPKALTDVSKIQMEKRWCAGCPKSFTVMSTSKQIYHTLECEKNNGNTGRSGHWQDRGYGSTIGQDGKIKWNKIPEQDKQRKNVIKLGEKSGPVIPSLEPKKLLDVQTEQKKTEKQKPKDVTLGQLIIARSRTPIKETSTQKIKNENQKKLITEERKGTPLMDSTQQSTNTNVEKLPALNSQDDLRQPIQESINVLTNTGNLMYQTMTSLAAPAPMLSASLSENKIHAIPDKPALTVDNAKVQAELGKQIISTMRMKLDILKFANHILPVKK